MSKVSRLRPTVALPLSEATLPRIRPGIVYVRVAGQPRWCSGLVHRAQQAKYFDDVAQKDVSTQWGVTGVGLHSRDAKSALSRQDCLYTLVERCAERDTARVIGACRVVRMRRRTTRSSAGHLPTNERGW